MFRWDSAFVAWLIEELRSRGQGGGAQVDAEPVAAPRVDGQVTDPPDAPPRRTPRQANLNARPGGIVPTVSASGQTWGLGDTNRRANPVERQRDTILPPGSYWPAEAPSPPVPPGVGYVYDPAVGDFARWLDPKDLWPRRYGTGSYAFPTQDYLTDELGANASLDYGGQLVGGVRSHHVVTVPNLSRARNALLPTGAGRYPNLPTFWRDMPLPIRDGTFVSYNQGGDPGVNLNLETSVPGTWPITRIDANGDTVIVGASATFDETRFIDPTGGVDNTVIVWFDWIADTPGSPRGTLALRIDTRVYSYHRDEVFQISNLRTTDYTESEAYAILQYPDVAGLGTPDVGIPYPRPGTWAGGDLEMAEGDSYWESRHIYATHGGYEYLGRVVSNAAYEAEKGVPLPGRATGDDAIAGRYVVHVPMGNTYRGFDVTSLDRLTTIRALAAAVPIMYQGDFGQIPRPYATTTGTFAGITWTADGTEGAETFVCCDAFTLDGVTYGIVLHQPINGEPTLDVSIDGTPVWSGPFRDAHPSDADFQFQADGSRVAFPVQTFLMPDWPFGIGGIGYVSRTGIAITGMPSQTETVIAFRPRYAFETWTDSPVVPL